jgi:hypothetical protein
LLAPLVKRFGKGMPLSKQIMCRKSHTASSKVNRIVKREARNARPLAGGLQRILMIFAVIIS